MPLTGGASGAAPLAPLAPLAALEQAILPHLRGGRCFVSFSGGIDSSLVLGVTTALARRIGAEDPIPLTWRFGADADRAWEDDWQEAVVAELGLSDWQRLEAGETLDWTGPVATRLLRGCGLLYPANTYVHAPLAEAAAGGVLLTGIGGDQVLGLWRGRDLAGVLARRRRPRAADLRAALPHALPPWLRVNAAARLRDDDRPAWLTAAGQDDLRRLSAAERQLDPVSWNAHLHWRVTRRDTALGLAALETLSQHTGTPVLAPLLHPLFVSVLARTGGRLGAGTRAETLERWFGGAVPAAVRSRAGKAVFGQAFWREHSRELARELADGDALAGDDLIDGAGLAAEWRSEQPSHRTTLLLQQHWLARVSRGAGGSAG